MGNRLVSAALFAAMAMVAGAVLADDPVYQVTANSAGVDLVGMGGYRTDALMGPASGTATVGGGPVTHAEGLTVADPFFLYGAGGTLSFEDAAACAFESEVPLNVSGTGAIVFKQGLEYRDSDWIVFGNGSGRDLEFNQHNYLKMYGRAGIGRDENGAVYEPARLTVSNVVFTVLYGWPTLYVACAGKDSEGNDVGGNGELVLDNVSATVYNLQLSNGKDALGAGKEKCSKVPIGRLVLKNGTELIVNNEIQTSANVIAAADSDGYCTNEVVLSSGSVLQVNQRIRRYDGPTTLITFDGGRLRRPYGATDSFLDEGGFGLNTSYLTVESTAGNDIVLENGNYSAGNSLYAGSGRTEIIAAGAIVKEGRGKLILNKPSGRFMFDGVKVNGGELRLYNDSTFNSGNGHGYLYVADGARFDLYNNDVHTLLLGGGHLFSSYTAAPGAFHLGASTNETLAPLFDGGCSLSKSGSGSTTITANALDAGSVAVGEGELKLVPNSAPGFFRRYRFRVTEVQGGASNPDELMEMAELRLLDGAVELSQFATRTYDDTTTKNNSGSGIFGNNETPANLFDGNLSNKLCDLRNVTQDVWYVEFDFGAPTRVTGYQWARTDSANRSPRAWTLEAGDDGETWTAISSVSDYSVAGMPNWSWVGGGQVFECELVDSTPSVQRLGAVSVAEGATLDLGDLAADVEVKSLVSNGEVELGSGALLLAGANGTSMTLAGVAGAPARVAKTGAGTLTLNGGSQIAAPLAVEAGTLRIKADAFSGKFFRFTVKALRGSTGVGELGKLHLFDADGVAVNTGLQWYGYDDSMSHDKSSNSRDGTPAKDVPAGYFSQAGNYAYSIWNGDYQDASRIFRAASDQNKWCTINHVFDANDPETWYTINFHLADGANRVVSYNLRTASGDPLREICVWSLEGSYDGVTWYELDARSIGNGTPGRANTWYNSGVPYVITQPDVADANGSFLGAGVVVSVAEGAVLDTSLVTGTEIAALAVDLEAGAGEITYFNPAAHGTLAVTGFSGLTPAGLTLPLTVDEFAPGAASRLVGWTVSVNGVEQQGLVIAIVNGALYLRHPGMTLLFR